MQKKYATALIIGRFQPFHKGHLSLILEALKHAEKVIIGIGSANVTDRDNPYSVQERKEMINTALKKAHLLERLDSIVPIDDHPNDDVWLQLVLSVVPHFDVAVGNNDWVNGILRKAGFRVLELPYYKRHIYEGKKIREKLRNAKKL